MNSECNKEQLLFLKIVYITVYSLCYLIIIRTSRESACFFLLLSGVQKARRTHCDHCHRNEFSRGPAPITAQLCAPLNRAVQNHANHFLTSSCATFHRAQKESRQGCPQQCARPSFGLEERPEKIEFTLLFFRSLLLLEI